MIPPQPQANRQNMLFNSIPFALFLPLVFLAFWALGTKRRTLQNAFLIAASYVFYGWWDWRFLFLIILSSLADYLIGMRIETTDDARKRKWLLWGSFAVNLGILGFFKYFNFFVDSFTDVLSAIGLQPNIMTLRIILPVGISFYTFQTMSYTLDIYRREIPATRDPIAFFAFVSFFPQLVAGPIERARDLLPQFLRKREFRSDLAADGMRQMLWGFFKKIVVADNLAHHVQDIYANYAQYDSLTLVLGTFFFAIQIYCDFSGYSDIAIGLARLFGFNLRRNFAFPYFSRDIAEFWRRWHISLSTWFRDYVFIPLGGNRCSTSRQIFNIFVTFTVSGLWHGSNWTFVIWGFLNGLYYVPIMLKGSQKSHAGLPAEGRLLPGPAEFGKMLTTFTLTLLAWVFFRANNVGHALAILQRIFSTTPNLDMVGFYARPLLISLFILAFEWWHRDQEHALALARLPRLARWPAYAGVVVAILVLGNFGSSQFIYFQF